MAGYVRVASVSDFREDFVRTFDVDGVHVGVVRHEGRFYAFSGYCTHARYSFDWTRVRPDDLIVCSSHYSWFELATGKAIDGPATEDLLIYNVRVEGDDVLVDPDPVS
jgi:nitrite reductase/ring-hydroxylating ferredoxin subunit